LPKGFED